jgi:tetratricopeptide (TPR) repeat protein
MNTTDFTIFKNFLKNRGHQHELDYEVLRHDLGATMNRHRLTGRQEGMNSLNTEQLSVIVSSNNGVDQRHPMTRYLLLSALLDDDQELIAQAQLQGIIPQEWSWMTWADGYVGDSAKLYRLITEIPEMRERCGAVILATKKNANAISESLLNLFFTIPTAKTYMTLLARALTGSQRTYFANLGLRQLIDCLEILFSGDTDKFLAALIDASDLENPENALRPFHDAAGEWSLVACARRHLECGRPQQALHMVKDLRFLSPAYDQAVTVAALAALECRQYDMSELYCRSIEDVDLRLKIITRLAQANGDIAIEVDALTQLFERFPNDGQIFIQLTRALSQIGQTALVTGLCYEAQERYADDETIQQLIRQYLKMR